MPTSINFDKKLGFINRTSIVLPSGPAVDFSTRSLSFDGTDEYISTQEVYSELDGQSKMSLSCWVKPNLDSHDVVVWINAAAGRVIGLVIYSTGMVRLQTQTSGNYAATSTGAVVANTWQHIMVCMDLSLGSNVNRGRIFIDGQDLTSGNNTYSGTFETSNGSFRIGSSTVGNYYGGLLDEVAIWSGTDLRNDVATIYNNGKPADLTSTNPTSWYRAGENSTFAYPQILMPEDTNKNKLSKYSLAFDGLSYVDCGDPNEFSFGNTKVDSRFSLSAWIYMNDATDFAIMSKYDTNVEYQFFVTSADRILFRLFSGGTTLNRIGRQTDPITSFENQWIHVAATYDGSSTLAGIKIYLNGNRVDTTDSSLNTYVAMSNTNASFEIGRISAVYADGKIDEAAVFPVELTQPDVQAIYNSGIPTDISSYSPVGYWKLGEEAKFTDNWLVPNSALSNYSKYSFNFDGNDDYIGLTTIILSGAFSISAWVKFSTLSSAESHIINTGTSNTNRIGVYDANDFSIKIAGTNVFINESGGNNFVTNQWQHVLVTRDASNNVSVFRNGAPFGSSTTLSGTLTLDSIFRFNTNQYALGYCDELAIWDSDQSAAVTTIYNGGKPKDLSGLSPLHWWRMGEEATYDGTSNQFTIPDQGSGGNTGTSSNTMLLETLVGDAPQYYGGGISDSMDIFDRVGDAPNSENNTVSFNMEEADIVEDTP